MLEARFARGSNRLTHLDDFDVKPTFHYAKFFERKVPRTVAKFVRKRSMLSSTDNVRAKITRNQ